MPELEPSYLADTFTALAGTVAEPAARTDVEAAFGGLGLVLSTANWHHAV